MVSLIDISIVFYIMEHFDAFLSWVSWSPPLSEWRLSESDLSTTSPPLLLLTVVPLRLVDALPELRRPFSGLGWNWQSFALPLFLGL